jgi:hypothetical protein
MTDAELYVIAAMLTALAAEEEGIGEAAPVYRPLIMSGGGAPIPEPEEEDFMQTSITLTNAQIKDVNTPYIIIPATETLGYSGAPATIPVPISVIIKLDNAAGAYSNVDSEAKFVIVWGSDWSLDLMQARAASIASGGSDYVFFPQYLNIVTESTETPAETVLHSHGIPPKLQGVNLSGNIQDNALAVVLSNASAGDLADGHADNSLTVTVVYYLVTL